LFTGVAPSPHWKSEITLQNHVIGKEIRQLDVRF